MKILFLTPQVTGWDMFGEHRAPNQLYAHWAAYVREKGYEDVEVLDCQALDIPQAEMLSKIKDKNPDIIVLGQEVTVPAGFAPFYFFNETAKKVKEILPQTKVVVGGLWYSGLPEHTLQEHPYIDFDVMSEEGAFYDLVDALAKGKNVHDVAGVASRLDGKVVMGPTRALLANLDELPLPAYDLFPMDKYVGHQYWKPFVEMVTSRGCPVACTFCYGLSKYDPRTIKDYVQWRCKSAERVIEELELLYNKYGVQVVLLQDDNFNVDMERVEKFCRLKLERNIPTKWVSLGRAVEWINCESILPLMKQSGMIMGVYGIEVTTPEELKKIGKGVDIEQIKKTVTILRQNNVAVVADLMLGFEHDNADIIRQRFDFCEEVDPDVLWVGYVTPAPNSPVWKTALKRGFIDLDKFDLRQADFVHPVMPTDHLSIEQLEKLGAQGLSRFFTKPGRVERIMTSDFDEMAKLCFKQAMEGTAVWASNISKGEVPAAASQVTRPAARPHLTAGDFLGMLHMGPGDLPPYVITPGQPERLGFLLSKLENPQKVFEVFGFQAHSGEMDGKNVMVCNGGADAPLAAIATEIFCTGGAHTIIRAGSCGSLQPEIKVGDIVIATSVLRRDGVTRAYVPDDYPAVADIHVVQALMNAAQALGVPYHLGPVWTTDAMLRETEDVWQPIAAMKVKAVDMVTSALFTISALHGVRAGAVLAVSDNLATHSIGLMDPAYHQAEMKAMQVCIEALKYLGHS